MPDTQKALLGLQSGADVLFHAVVETAEIVE